MSVDVLRCLEKPLLHDTLLQQQQQQQSASLALEGAVAMLRPSPIQIQQQQHHQWQQQAQSPLTPAVDGGHLVEHRKLVVLGLPWETDEETMQQYFSQYGALEEAVIMRDRATGKSRGFGFVTYLHEADAQQVAMTAHQVDGRRCEAKFALPRGGNNPNRTTRIFVARIPNTVSDQQFRAYFEQFGSIQDAYMPKDALKQGHRGIGFVTYASAEPVEHVMSSNHFLNGQELAIDCATPKDKRSSLQPQSGRRLSLQQLASSLSPTQSLGFSPFGHAPFSSVLDSLAQHSSPGDTHSPSSSSTSFMQSLGCHATADSHSSRLNPDLLLGLQGLDVQGNGSAGVLQAFQGLPGYRGTGNGIGIGLGLQQLAQARAQAQLSAHQVTLGSSSLYLGQARQLPAGYHSNGDVVETNQLGSDLSGAYLPSLLTPGSPSLSVPPSPSLVAEFQEKAGDSLGSSHSSSTAREAGPRIFVGKLVRGTTENDVRDYFSKFGYVMDVYMPRDRMNRAEHRGFGFVTFETEASIIRVASYGGHMIRGSVVAIDAAVPRRDQDGNQIVMEELIRRSVAPGLDPSMVLEMGPDRHHASDRWKQGYRPY